MATKKAASSAKKPRSQKQTTTKVTTVKAVESPTSMPTAAKKAKKFSLTRMPLVAALVAEFVGTFIFAATIIAGQGQPILVFFALTGVVLAVGAVSGGYMNPALVIGSWLTRRISGTRALTYIVAQVLGAMLALVVLNAYVHAAPATSASDALSSSGAVALFKAAAIPENKEWLLFFSEVIGTLIFGFAVAAASREKRNRATAAVTMGLGAFLGLMVAGSAAAFVGGSAILNPAVAVALQAINFNTIWPLMVYAVGTTLGAIVGFFLYDLIRENEEVS